MCAPVSNLYSVYITNYNNNCLFDILLCLQPILIHYSSHTTIRYSAHNVNVRTTTVLFTRKTTSHRTD